ncbi:LysR family transcriptional regulator [Herminiimonas arsenitoxidans]|uniref:LysR family transcriptional regulator n=1 Tax=Herminiimonas arsenitoxidans TaxID=1809410 RepID=UPI000970C742|nr:LysR family transcriptional regulator [Herminiimonas arsenitoxidans]
MDNLSSLNVFVHAGEARSFTAAGQQLGISASAVSKAIVRLEERLGVRLFHRSTRAINLTPEGALFLERCRRILCEVEAAEAELLQTQSAPQGKLRISMPSLSVKFMSGLAKFQSRYPDVALDIDCSDRLVDVIEEGFDAVIRTGKPSDSRLMARTLGSYRRIIVGSPEYFERNGRPLQPEDLRHHACLLYRFPSTGKLDVWSLSRNGEPLAIDLSASMMTNSLNPQVCFAEQGIGLACVPDLTIQRQLDEGKLISVLDEYNQERTPLNILWPSSRHLSPKLRVFVDFVAENLTLP